MYCFFLLTQYRNENEEANVALWNIIETIQLVSEWFLDGTLPQYRLECHTMKKQSNILLDRV